MKQARNAIVSFGGDDSCMDQSYRSERELRQEKSVRLGLRSGSPFLDLLLRGRLAR